MPTLKTNEALGESFLADRYGREIMYEKSKEAVKEEIIYNSKTAIDLIKNLNKSVFSDVEICEIVSEEYSAGSLAEYLYEFVTQSNNKADQR